MSYSSLIQSYVQHRIVMDQVSDVKTGFSEPKSIRISNTDWTQALNIISILIFLFLLMIFIVL